MHEYSGFGCLVPSSLHGPSLPSDLERREALPYAFGTAATMVCGSSPTPRGAATEGGCRAPPRRPGGRMCFSTLGVILASGLNPTRGVYDHQSRRTEAGSVEAPDGGPPHVGAGLRPARTKTLRGSNRGGSAGGEPRAEGGSNSGAIVGARHAVRARGGGAPRSRHPRPAAW